MRGYNRDMSRDLRRYSRQTNFRLLIGFFLLLVLVGVGSIYFIYGRDAAWMGLVCILGALVPVVLVWGLLTILGWVAKKVDQ